jgi:hypothetical protein
MQRQMVGEPGTVSLMPLPVRNGIFLTTVMHTLRQTLAGLDARWREDERRARA